LGWGITTDTAKEALQILGIHLIFDFPSRDDFGLRVLFGIAPNKNDRPSQEVTMVILPRKADNEGGNENDEYTL